MSTIIGEEVTDSHVANMKDIAALAAENCYRNMLLAGQVADQWNKLTGQGKHASRDDIRRSVS